MLRLDGWTRLGLIAAGAFGAYSLGANNIANVMGVFVSASPFEELAFGDLVRVTSTQQLFLMGGLAISLGIYTYSYRVMTTVGGELFKLTPINALIVVFASSLVLFVFASQGLQRGLAWAGLPTFPLVPVSSTQAIVGAIIGVALASGGRNVNYRVLGRIASGWAVAPVLAALLSFVMLFFVQNVFEQTVVAPDPMATEAASPVHAGDQAPLVASPPADSAAPEALAPADSGHAADAPPVGQEREASGPGGSGEVGTGSGPPSDP